MTRKRFLDTPGVGWTFPEKIAAAPPAAPLAVANRSSLVQGLSLPVVGVVTVAVVLAFMCVLRKRAYQDGEGCLPALSMGRYGRGVGQKKGTPRTLGRSRTL